MSNNNALPPNNGAVLTIAQIIKAVMLSAAEAETGALYINCQEAIPARHTLEFLGHTQPPTPMQTNNTTALNVVNNTVMKNLKAMDMKYHWLRCRESQGQFCHYWASGKPTMVTMSPNFMCLFIIRQQDQFFVTPIKIVQELRRRVTNLLTEKTHLVKGRI